jgi:hypothetical protein
VARANLTPDSWFQSVVLLDVHLSRSKDEDSLYRLPATCAALVSLLKKNDSAIEAFSGVCFIRLATQFAQYLQSLGYATAQEITDEMINTQEMVLLQALNWQIRMPTPSTWISMFTARFNVLTRNFLVPSLSWVCQKSLLAAHHAVMREAPSQELPPKALAAGLLGIGLVGARLIPLEAIKPPKLSDEDWARLYASSQPMAQTATCVLSTADSSKLLDLLVVTVGASLTEIKESCHLAALSMADAAQEAPDMNMQRHRLGARSSHPWIAQGSLTSV